ncbi:MAG: sugar ABC transporter substrate-binding protein [Chloroflexota bacterium]
MFKRLVTALGLAAFLFGADLAGTQPTAIQAASTTISFMTFSASPDHLKDLDKIRQVFERTNPRIHIKVIPVAYDQYFTKLQVAVAGNNAPDTFELNYENFVSYSSKNTLLDLAKVAPKARYARAFYARALGAFRAHGKQYGLPESFSDVLLFYNKDLFNQAHLKYPSATWHWSDELKAAQKLTDTSRGVYGDFEPVQFFEFYKVLAQAGGTFFNKSHTRVAFNSAAGLRAVQWLVDKTRSYHVMPSPAQMGGLSDGDMFKAGKLAMLRTGIWMFPDFSKAGIHWDVQLEPSYKRRAHHYFANAVVISAKTHNAKAAYKWLRFLTTSATMANVRISSSWELPALKSKKLVAAYLHQTPPQHRSVVFSALNSPVLPPVIASESQMQDIITKDLQQVLDGSLSSKAALSDMASKVNSLLH